MAFIGWLLAAPTLLASLAEGAHTYGCVQQVVHFGGQSAEGVWNEAQQTCNNGGQKTLTIPYVASCSGTSLGNKPYNHKVTKKTDERQNTVMLWRSDDPCKPFLEGETDVMCSVCGKVTRGCCLRIYFYGCGMGFFLFQFPPRRFSLPRSWKNG